MLAVPFILVYDFESFLIPNKHETMIEKHVVNSFCYKVICSFDSSLNSELTLYRGPNAVDKFLECLKAERSGAISSCES